MQEIGTRRTDFSGILFPPPVRSGHQIGYRRGEITRRKKNHGQVWANLGQQAAETQIRSLAYLGNGIALAVSGPNGKIFRSTDYGVTWADLGQQAAETYILSLAYLGNGIALAGTYPNAKIFRSV